MARVIHIRTLTVTAAKIILIILCYCSVSITLVFANKHLVGDHDSVNNLSLFVVWFQCIITVLFILCVHTCRAFCTCDWKPLTLSRKVLFSSPILRMTCTFVCMLAFNNLCLRHVDVSFYQVARSLTIIFVAVFSILILKRSVSWRIILCCVVVAGGFFLGIDQEKFFGNLSVKGVLYGVASSLFVAINGIFTKQALDAVDGDSYMLTLYSNINASILFIPVVFMTGQFKEAQLSLPQQNSAFWIFLFTTGVLCFFIAWIGSIQINITSPLTHTIIANSKAILQTLIAVFYFDESKSTLWWISNFLVVGGAFSYTVVKMQEEASKASLLSPRMGQDQMEKGEKNDLSSLENETTENVRKTPNGLKI